MTDPDSAATLAQQLRERSERPIYRFTADAVLDRSAAEALERHQKEIQRWADLWADAHNNNGHALADTLSKQLAEADAVIIETYADEPETQQRASRVRAAFERHASRTGQNEERKA